MIKVPAAVKNAAQYAFTLRKFGFSGATSTGWKRAKQLATEDSIAIEDVRYIRNWFARHVITSYPTYYNWKQAGRPNESIWYNKRGIVAWQTWGGDAGFDWINSSKVIKILNDEYGRKYSVVKYN
jgi:hypothetical protein